MVEGAEHLRSVSSSLLAVEAAARGGETNIKAMRELFRSIHTLKGLSAMVAVEPIVAIAHRMETALQGANQGSGRLSLAAIDTLLQAAEVIGQGLRQVGEGKPVDAPSPALLERLDAIEAVLPGAPPRLDLDLEPELLARLAPIERQHLAAGLASGHRAVAAEFSPSALRSAQGLTITSVREAVGRLGEIVKVVPRSGPEGLLFVLLVLTRQPDAAIAAAMGVEPNTIRRVDRAPAAPTEAARAPGRDDAGTSAPEVGVVRVEVARLDDAMERLSALIVTRFRLSAAVTGMTEAGVDTRELRSILQDLRRQHGELRASLLKARMVSLGEVLERVPLLFRGLKRSTGKQVRLELDVGAAELDKAVAERLFPAIVHLVRNAVDHAIESPATRGAAGKPEEGVVRISCTERTNTYLELVVADDGRGIDGAQLARRAKRPVPSGAAALLELLCLPGLSIREEATTTSGRGMGMNIVHRIAVEELGGELSLSTSPGQSTSFTLRVPLTISVVAAFALECGGQRFLVPVSAVEEIIEVEPTTAVRAPDTAGRGVRSAVMIDRRGEAIPLLALEALLGGGPGSGARKALVVRRGGQPVAFSVDRLLGQQDVVVRPLEDPLTRVLGVSGSTDLGDGRPTLVLDLLTLATSLLASAAPLPEVLS